jgi:hypothetical protein
MVAGVAPTVITALNQYRCSIDPSRTMAARELQLRRDGFEHVCKGDLDRFSVAFGSIEKAVRQLAFTPVNLTKTPFAGLEGLGAKTEFESEVPSRLYRGFRTADGHRLTLFEHDMSADGSSTWRNPKDEAERINGLPAQLVVMEDSAGAAISHLSWVEGRRAYELWVDANTKKIRPLHEQLFTLAASLPASIPGCPKEIPPKPVRVGVEGFPVDEPLPQVLDPIETGGVLNGKQRPCK